MLEIIEKSERMIKKSKYETLIINLSKINDEQKFNEKLDSMNEIEKRDFEEAIIGLTYYESISKEEQLFFDKYINYCMKKSQNNIMEWINNEYLKYVFINKNIEYEKDTSKEISLNGIPIKDLLEALDEKYNEIMNKMDTRDLNNEEKNFIINYIDIYIDYYGISNNDGIMQDIIMFFEKYKINNLESPKNRKMYILYTLSKELVKYNCNSIIKFNNFDTKNKRDMGYFKKINENTGLIIVNRTNSIFIETEKDFIEKLFTIYHELAHFKQEFGNREYTKEEKEQMEMEREVIKKNKEFYLKYHDNFFLERDADLFAIAMIRKNLYFYKTGEVIKDIINNRKLIDQKIFVKYLLKEYMKHSNEDIVSNHKKH